MSDGMNCNAENEKTQVYGQYHAPQLLSLGPIHSVVQNQAGVGTDVNPPSANSSLS